MVFVAEEAAKILEKEGISLEIIDLRSLSPLDEEAIEKTVKKTNRVILLQEQNKTGGIAGEIAAIINERAFDSLDAPIKRVSGADVPMPYAKNLENLAVPDVARIVAAVREVAYLD